MMGVNMTFYISQKLYHKQYYYIWHSFIYLLSPDRTVNEKSNQNLLILNHADHNQIKASSLE